MASPHPATSTQRLIWAAAGGVLVAVVLVALGQPSLAPLGAWDAAGLVYIASVYHTVRRLDGAATKAVAMREDQSKPVADLIIILASLASLLAVGVLIFTAGSGTSAQMLSFSFGLASIAVSWLLIHTLFMLGYARLYYGDGAGGIKFADTKTPSYLDFAYLAFTIGMTFQVSDTELSNRPLRSAALRHAALSYVFGTVILATTINLVAGLSH